LTLNRARPPRGDEQRAILREAQARLALAEEESRRTALLHRKGIIPEADDTRARGEVARYRAMADAAATAIGRMEQDEKTRRSDRLVRIERLRGTHTRLEGELTTLSASVKRLEYEVERRVFERRSTVASPRLQTCAWVAWCARGTGSHQSFPKDRRASSHTSRLPRRLDGSSMVSRHAFDSRDSLGPSTEQSVRRSHVCLTKSAEDLSGLSLTVDSLPSSIQIAHALPGSVEVEVERVRPAKLVLRTLGGLLTRRVNAASAQASPRTN